MKKVQRSFAVEYKFSRRKADPKSNSIWGNMDLRSVAQDVQEVEMTRLSKEPRSGKPGSQPSLSAEEQAGPLLTLPTGQQTTASALQEIKMADEKDTMTNADPAAVAASDVPKKQRKPRAKKATPEIASAEVAAEPVGGKQKRARKPKSTGNTGSAKRTPVRRASKVAKTATVVPAAAIDEMADLLQLEEENQKLRKLLAEKLRAENADLRKRLKLD
ncbi:transcriptional regulator [Rhizobium sp. LCM 4573]|uniref:transcriptional regulator n=1 Tax=Rhizobium sp. LCM 4573 TaxID=1848291 RepID=UPI0008D92815|nr:transcriptional regulator [Rhizobium sp. LCM 4573]OHV77275.1 transcriptional regulator [Rhizobium sp. LCM 4573]